MQTAKKLVLVNEFDREYKRLQRHADAAKADHSLQLSDTLRDQSVADDRKVREYVAALHRYLNVRNRKQDLTSAHCRQWLVDDEGKSIIRGLHTDVEHIAFTGQFWWRTHFATLQRTIGARG